MNHWEHIKGLSSGVPGMAAAVFIYFALACLIQVKDKWWRKGILLLVCWGLCIMIIFIGDLVNLTCTLVFFLAGLWISCEGSRLKKLTLGLMFSSTVFAFNAFYDNCVGFLAHYFEKDTFYGNMYLPGRLLFAILFYLAIRLRKPERDFELSPSLWKLMLMLTLSPFGIMISVILLRSPYSSIAGTVIADAALFLVVMLSFAGLLRALVVLDRQQRLEQENALVLLNQRYYENMEQQQFEIRRLRHDMANHLQTLLALPQQQKDDYIRGMIDNPAFGQVLSWCGDSTVNAVLTAKESLMRQRNIKFSARVDLPGELPFEKADLCAVFANALDNAVEGCMNLEEPLREIHLDARLGQGILAVNIKNACEGVRTGEESAQGKAGRKNAGPAGEAYLPQTTKKDAQNHGFGLKSIQKTVKKYGGNMEIKREEQSFQLFLYLPVE